MKIYKQNEIDKLATILDNDGIICVPTDTVYGLCARINSILAYEHLLKVKNRPKNKLFPIMCANLEQIKEIAIVDRRAEKIINNFMPGPITIILDKRPELPEYINNGENTVAIRMAPSKILKDLIYKISCPLFMSSANQSGHEVCRNIEEIQKELPLLDAIMEGKLGIGEASTIIDCTSNEIKVLRKGPIKIEDILKIIN